MFWERSGSSIRIRAPARECVHLNNQQVRNVMGKEVAPRAGFEPATNRLTVDCSTAELSGNLHVCAQGVFYGA